MLRHPMIGPDPIKSKTTKQKNTPEKGGGLWGFWELVLHAQKISQRWQREAAVKVSWEVRDWHFDPGVGCRATLPEHNFNATTFSFSRHSHAGI